MMHVVPILFVLAILGPSCSLAFTEYNFVLGEVESGKFNIGYGDSPVDPSTWNYVQFAGMSGGDPEPGTAPGVQVRYYQPVLFLEDCVTPADPGAIQLDTAGAQNPYAGTDAVYFQNPYWYVYFTIGSWAGTDHDQNNDATVFSFCLEWKAMYVTGGGTAEEMASKNYQISIDVIESNFAVSSSSGFAQDEVRTSVFSFVSGSTITATWPQTEPVPVGGKAEFTMRADDADYQITAVTDVDIAVGVTTTNLINANGDIYDGSLLSLSGQANSRTVRLRFPRYMYSLDGPQAVSITGKCTVQRFRRRLLAVGSTAYDPEDLNSQVTDEPFVVRGMLAQAEAEKEEAMSSGDVETSYVFCIASIAVGVGGAILVQQ